MYIEAVTCLHIQNSAIYISRDYTGIRKSRLAAFLAHYISTISIFYTPSIHLSSVFHRGQCQYGPRAYPGNTGHEVE